MKLSSETGAALRMSEDSRKHSDHVSGEAHPDRPWMEKPLSGLYCVLAWLVATAIFFGMSALLGGPAEGDATESIYSTWAIEHGSVACSYLPANSVTNTFLPDYQPGPHPPPLWPLASGGLAAVLKIGHTLPFPSNHALGKNCSDGYTAMYQWAGKTLSLVPTVGLGYVSWFVLLAGFVALLPRGRARTLPMGGHRRRFSGTCSDRMDAVAGLLPSSRHCCDGTGARRHRLRCAKKVGLGWRTPRFGHHVSTIHPAGAFASCCNRSIKAAMETYRRIGWSVDGCVTSDGSHNVR